MQQQRWLVLAALVGAAVAFTLGRASVTVPYAQPARDSGAPVVSASPELAAFKEHSKALIAAYVREHSLRRLQIGAGSGRRPGWLNTDIEPGEGLAYLDVTERFPLDDGSFHYVASEHVIEHVPFEGGRNMIEESYRVLAPGGTVRIATPNLLRYVELFSAEKTDAMRAYIDGKLAWHKWPRHPNSATIILNLQMSSWGHQFLYDAETLRAALTRAGFASVRDHAVGESDDPNLQQIEGRPYSSIAQLNAYETMVLEAVKPQ
jgi:predicted SAM-dependent methyltransferase